MPIYEQYSGYTCAFTFVPASRQAVHSEMPAKTFLCGLLGIRSIHT